MRRRVARPRTGTKTPLAGAPGTEARDAEETVDRPGRRSLPGRVVDAEAAYVKNRRTKARLDVTDPVVGVALSGGGIRSATFNLGVLQELAAAGRLRFVDYICTVSGGGYIGSCLSSLLSHGKPGAEQVEDAMLRREQIHHLRKHGDFLITRHGLFSFQVLRALGNGLTGLGLTLGLYAFLVLVCASMALAYVFALGGTGLETALQSPWPGWKVAASELLMPSPAALPWLLGAAGAGAVLMVGIGSVVTRSPKPVGPAESTGPVVPGQERGALATFTVVALLGLLAAPFAAWAVGRQDGGTSYLWLPTAFFVGARTGLLFFYVGTSWRPSVALGVSTRWDRRFRSALGAVQGAALYSTLAAAALAVLPLLLWYLRDRGLYAVASAVFSFVAVRTAVPKASGGSEKPGWIVRAKNLMGQAALNLAVPGFVVSCLVVTWWAILEWAGDPVIVSLLLALIATAVVGVLGFVVNYNLISPHYFYRDRLAEAYLRTERKTDAGYQERDDSELALVDLLGPAPACWTKARDEALASARALERAGEAGAAGQADQRQALQIALAKLMVPPDSAAPYHLICCALNLAGSRDLVRRSRKSDHFVFSRLFCGSSTTGYVPTAVYRQGETKLARAITISGAAASPAMGTFTNSTTAFALSLLNIRLGSWMVNPRLYKRPLVSYPDDAVLLDEEEPAPRKRTWEQERLVFWPKYLFREVFGLTDAEDELVHLSDGGHTGDNLGLYPLLQRRCDLIVACDGGYDPEYSFDSLAAAIRQIDVDENVKIDIDLVRLQPKAGANTVESHFGIGRIEYPTVGSTKGKVGWLLYVRASRLADIPAAVASYWKLNPDFPYQTTADQFFDDDQFESYRALGSYSASLLTSGWDSGLQWVKWCDDWYKTNRRRGGPAHMAVAIPAAQQAPLMAPAGTLGGIGQPPDKGAAK